MTLQMLLLLSLLLFTLGLIAVLHRRNLITILVGIELMLNAASLNFMIFNKYVAPDPAVGQVLVLVVIGLAAAEVAVFLSILMIMYRSRSGIDVNTITDLKG